MHRLFSFCLSLFIFFAGASAHALDAPQSSPILTVSGDIVVTNSGDRAEFDRALLQTLDWVEIVTHTPFTEGPQTFAGPTLASLLKALGVEDGTLLATALNDYTIDIPVADAWAHDVLLAVDHDGRPMRTRNRGPIWIVYPAATPDDFEDVHGARMIWQLNRIRVQR